MMIASKICEMRCEKYIMKIANNFSILLFSIADTQM